MVDEPPIRGKFQGVLEFKCINFTLLVERGENTTLINTGSSKDTTSGLGTHTNLDPGDSLIKYIYPNIPTPGLDYPSLRNTLLYGRSDERGTEHSCVTLPGTDGWSFSPEGSLV